MINDQRLYVEDPRLQPSGMTSNRQRQRLISRTETLRDDEGETLRDDEGETLRDDEGETLRDDEGETLRDDEGEVRGPQGRG